MGTQEGLTRYLKVRGKCWECENLSVREFLASVAPLHSCWVIFLLQEDIWSILPLYKGMHPRWPCTLSAVILPETVGMYHVDSGGHSQSLCSCLSSRNQQRQLLQREAEAALTRSSQWDFPLCLPSLLSSKVRPPVWFTVSSQHTLWGERRNPFSDFCLGLIP